MAANRAQQPRVHWCCAVQESPLFPGCNIQKKPGFSVYTEQGSLPVWDGWQRAQEELDLLLAKNNVKVPIKFREARQELDTTNILIISVC